MQIPPRISFHNLDPSDALKARIDQKIAKLNEHFPHLVGIQVMVEAAHRHQQKGGLYSLHITATLPGGELVVSEHPGKNPKKHDKIFAAMNSAFLAIEKQLNRFKETRRSEIKTHLSTMQTGVVSNFFPDEGFGFVSTIDGTEIYFHEHSVGNKHFNKLDIGSKVRFVIAENLGEKGQHASHVRPIK